MDAVISESSENINDTVAVSEYQGGIEDTMTVNPKEIEKNQIDVAPVVDVETDLNISNNIEGLSEVKQNELHSEVNGDDINEAIVAMEEIHSVKNVESNEGCQNELPVTEISSELLPPEHIISEVVITENNNTESEMPVTPVEEGRTYKDIKKSDICVEKIESDEIQTDLLLDNASEISFPVSGGISEPVLVTSEANLISDTTENGTQPTYETVAIEVPDNMIMEVDHSEEVSISEYNDSYQEMALNNEISLTESSLVTNHDINESGSINTMKKPSSLATESILNALSEIHGEHSLNVSNGVPIRVSSYEITPDTLEKVVRQSKQFKKKKDLAKPVPNRGRPALNDKQLLAILQDGTPSLTTSMSALLPNESAKKEFRIIRKRKMNMEVERQIVLKQLREFPRKRRMKDGAKNRIEDVKIPEVIKKKTATPPKAPLQTSTPAKADISSIINEWSEDEVSIPSTPVQNDTLSSKVNTTTESTTCNSTVATNIDSSLTSNSESFVKPQRIARKIKKKIIYDPDNPETFKFASDVVQAAETKQIKTIDKQKSHTNESKQNKADAKQKMSTDVMQSKTTVTPEIKQSKTGSPEKQNKSPNDLKTPSKMVTKKRLTEVDKLLMDEGAVNMLYQIEQSNNEGEEKQQEQSKKKKMTSISNERKVKIIKKAVINHSKSNADQSTKTFRVRKEKIDNNNLNNNLKIAVNTAARASMQSPSPSEKSAVSVNESRIIRRHSSSSFSSGCMSPRPQSPVADMSKSMNDSGIHSKIIKRKGSRQKKALKNPDKTESSFLSPITPMPDVATLQMKSFTQLSMHLTENVAHIKLNPTSNTEELFDYQVITELTAAIRLCPGTGGVLLSSSQGALCGGLDLRGLLLPTVDQQRHHAEQLLDAFRELMVALCECRPALVCSVGGACIGPGVALLTLCDLVLASDRATFCVSPRVRRKLPPEGAALLTRPYALPPQISRELVLCGRKLTASEALQRGIVSRTLWPDRFDEEVNQIVGELSQHPTGSFSIMKNILHRGEVTAVTSALRHEGRLLLDYWCSPTGQEAIKETHRHLMANEL